MAEKIAGYDRSKFTPEGKVLGDFAFQDVNVRFRGGGKSALPFEIWEHVPTGQDFNFSAQIVGQRPKESDLQSSFDAFLRDKAFRDARQSREELFTGSTFEKESATRKSAKQQDDTCLVDNYLTASDLRGVISDPKGALPDPTGKLKDKPTREEYIQQLIDGSDADLLRAVLPKVKDEDLYSHFLTKVKPVGILNRSPDKDRLMNRFYIGAFAAVQDEVDTAIEQSELLITKNLDTIRGSSDKTSNLAVGAQDNIDRHERAIENYRKMKIDLDSLTLSAKSGIEQGENFLSNVIFGEGVGALDFSKDKIDRLAGKGQAWQKGRAQEDYVSVGDYNTNPNQTSTGVTVSSSVAAGTYVPPKPKPLRSQADGEEWAADNFPVDFKGTPEQRQGLIDVWRANPALSNVADVARIWVNENLDIDDETAANAGLTGKEEAVSHYINDVLGIATLKVRYNDQGEVITFNETTGQWETTGQSVKEIIKKGGAEVSAGNKGSIVAQPKVSVNVDELPSGTTGGAATGGGDKDALKNLIAMQLVQDELYKSQTPSEVFSRLGTTGQLLEGGVLPQQLSSFGQAALQNMLTEQLIPAYTAELASAFATPEGTTPPDMTGGFEGFLAGGMGNMQMTPEQADAARTNAINALRRLDLADAGQAFADPARGAAAESLRAFLTQGTRTMDSASNEALINLLAGPTLSRVAPGLRDSVLQQIQLQAQRRQKVRPEMPLFEQFAEKPMVYTNPTRVGNQSVDPYATSFQQFIGS